MAAIKTFFYNLLFHHSNPVSTQWGYYEILKKMPENSSLLDVGVGDGIYFINEKVINLIKSKNLKIYGIDIDLPSIKVCQNRIIQYNLENYVKAECVSLFDVKAKTESEKYDNILFMESFPVISNELFIEFISHSKGILSNRLINRGGNKIYLYHNLIENHEYSRVFEFLKRNVLYALRFGWVEDF